MRSALICVFFALLIHREGSGATNDADFRPTPIPLDDWQGQKNVQPAGTLQETIVTSAAPSVAAVPVHYWEDALRHSVYLTLVRDKIDQLIAKGNVISPDSKPELHASKEIDDHNLWEKIKSAPFDRLEVDEPEILGDITVMSKGRLLEDKDGFRFTEDEKSEKCNDGKCTEGVKALWSVKRVRQRDAETVPGKYHYELTFSVSSQTPKKHKKPYDNPVRTFTVQEGTPVEQPQYNTQPALSYGPRPQRAVWFHKNIAPTQHYQSRKTYQPHGLDRLFLSLFSSEEDRYDGPPRHRPNPYVQQGRPPHQHAKAGYAGSQNEQHHQKKLSSYPYKHTTYSRPPLGPPPSVSQAEHHYIDSDKLKIPFSPPIVQNLNIDSDKLKIPFSPPIVPNHHIGSDKLEIPFSSPIVQNHHTDSDNLKIPFAPPLVQHHQIDSEVKTKNPYPPQVQYHYDLKSKVQPPSQFQHQHQHIQADVKTKKPHSPQQDFGYQPSNVVKTTKPAVLPTPPLPPLKMTTEVTSNISEVTTKEPEVIHAFKPYPKHRPPPTKVSYLPEHVRPPVFNAPPGVFVTMDKKPFKPMPPLKFHYSHPPKPVKHRPVDFRPSPQVLDVQLFSDPDPLSDAFRPMNLNYADSNTTDTSEKAGSGKLKNVNKTKPPKKHELIKSHRPTTSTPEIITAQSQSIEAGESMHWANNLLGAFVKTTPMEPQKYTNVTETTTPFASTTTVTDPTTTVTLRTTTKEVKKLEEKTTTTPRPTKRTRPPPKFTKPEKLKKHKRITTTTTTPTTYTSTTTEKPRHKRPLQDLTPQASSAATGTTKPTWQLKSKIRNDNLTTTSISTEDTNATTSRPSTTTRTFTTTSRPTTTTTKITTTTTTTLAPHTPETEPPIPTTQPKSKNRFRQSTLMQKGTSVNHDKWSVPFSERNKTVYTNGNYQQRRKGSNFHGYVSSTPKNVDEDHHNEEHVDLAYNTNAIGSSSTTEMLLEVIPATPEPTQPTSENHVEEQSDYPHGTEETEQDAEDSEESKEHDEEQELKDQEEFIFTQTESSNNSNEVNAQSQDIKEETIVTTPHANIKNKTKCKKKKHLNLTTTEETSYVFNDLEINVTKCNLEDFLDSLEGKKRDNVTNDDQYDEDEKDDVDVDDDEDDEDDEGFSPFNNEEDEESRTPRHADVNYEDYRDRPYSFLELMAME